MGVGYLILQAEGTFDINTVFAGILVLTALRAGARWRRRRRGAAPDDLGSLGPAQAAEGLPGLPPVNRAARFSRKCATPSSKSEVWKESSISWFAWRGGFGQGPGTRPPRAAASSRRPNAARRCWRARVAPGRVSAISLSSGMTLLTRPKRQRLRRAELRAEQRRSSAAGAHQPGQQPAYAMLGDQAALGEGGGEDGGLAREAQVRVERDDHAETRRRTVDCSDDEFRNGWEVG